MAIEDYLAGNQRYVEEFDGADLPIVPRTKTIIVSCVDSRVDPAQIFGLDNGDAFVLRSVGGRVTPHMIAQVAMVQTLAGPQPDTGPLDVIVMHHTQCGTARFHDDDLRSRAASAAGVDEAAITPVIVVDPYESVTADKALLEDALPGGTDVTAFVYDLRTGQVTQV
jgi:carbonic anhydrase